MDCPSAVLFKNGYRKRGLALMVVCTACLLGFALASPPALADPTQTRQILQVGYMEFPPFTYQNSRGQAAGEFIDITRKVVLEAGYTTEFVFLPPSRLLLHLRNGTVDLAPSLSGTPLLVYETLESWVSPVTLELHAWHLNTTETLKTFDQIKHKRVIVISGYNYGGLMSWMEKQSDIALTEAPGHRAAIEMLKRNRGDYLLDYHKPVQELLSAPGDENLHSTKLLSREGVWVFALSRPQAEIWREQFDDAYIRLAEKGEVPPLRRLGPGYKITGFPNL
ncbi:substrate-binding periplasmic protein [Marinobacter sp. ELB17]|uniref:substrate-binding periplasmic protein n=1 Tax=Marinobacter sp. ELB17 TaxID=270374 RepID=UPI0000F36C47|nr:transporter substrate-binding domain-containing protein [Marinobacter sp. ELB17]EBA01290.1 ABC-type amino acid transport/signal transduction systems, periplasmic component/domain [Marinobacter sp. ELB17]